ncbi:MAG: hypothetical protein R2788_16590 [Saprospiraceae bacterium]
MEIIILTIIVAAIITALPLSGNNVFPEIMLKEIIEFISNNSDYNFRKRPEAKKLFMPIINNNEFYNDLNEKILIVDNNNLLPKSD